MLKQKPIVISLFSGAGGLDAGLKKAGYDIRVALDFDHDSCETLRLNYKNTVVIEGDIQKITTDELFSKANCKLGDIDLLVGGPPCQPFSKSAFWNGSKGLKDPRAVTLHEYIRVLTEMKPKAFILENVFGLAYKNHKEAFDYLKEGFKALGYHINCKVVNAADYGVPQLRQRLIILGSRDKLIEFPHKTHLPPSEKDNGMLFEFNENLPFHVSAKTAFTGLRPILKEELGSELKVNGKWGHLLPDIPPGDNYLFYTEKKGHKNPLFEWRSRYWSFLLKLSPDKPSWTIQAQPGPYVGPFHWENRRLTFAEMKRIQTFPDKYEFYGKRSSIQKQIGNAVPSLLAQKLGEAVKEQLFR